MAARTAPPAPERPAGGRRGRARGGSAGRGRWRHAAGALQARDPSPGWCWLRGSGSAAGGVTRCADGEPRVAPAPDTAPGSWSGCAGIRRPPWRPAGAADSTRGACRTVRATRAGKPGGRGRQVYRWSLRREPGGTHVAGERWRTVRLAPAGGVPAGEPLTAAGRAVAGDIVTAAVRHTVQRVLERGRRVEERTAAPDPASGLSGYPHRPPETSAGRPARRQWRPPGQPQSPAREHGRGAAAGPAPGGPDPRRTPTHRRRRRASTWSNWPTRWYAASTTGSSPTANGSAASDGPGTSRSTACHCSS